jgi:hypothetical protein
MRTLWKSKLLAIRQCHFPVAARAADASLLLRRGLTVTVTLRFPASLRTGPHIHVRALATMLLARVAAFAACGGTDDFLRRASDLFKYAAVMKYLLEGGDMTVGVP